MLTMVSLAATQYIVSTTIVEMLLQAGADIEAKNQAG
eukprot:gene26967-biopygen17541